jgi:uncharacterized protein (TIGR00251 family)
MRGTMGRTDFLERVGDRCRIWIDASPGASRSEVVGVSQWRRALQVKIGAQPRDGEANEELLRFLSEKIGVPRRDVVLVRGERSSSKLVEVPLAEDEVRRRLGV